MLRIFEAIKKSPFFNGNYSFCPLPKNAPAEIFADAQLISECHATEDDLSSDDWHLYTLFIAWVARHLLAQRRFSLALKHSFLLLFSVKK